MKRVRGVAATAALVGAVLGLGGCGIAPTTPTETSTSTSSTTTQAAMQRVQLAANACMVGHITQDEGTSITLDTKGSEDGTGVISETVEDVGCVLGELEAPDYVTQHISTTRALDGQQTDEWDDIEARWTYHPDDGLQITFIDRA
ncbi:hypothetical protein [Janibacter sp. LM]|uniref:hypothetical protein n=1 Tax=Janibacter sp. LM TaxID=3144845 RepID=UPI0031F72069